MVYKVFQRLLLLGLCVPTFSLSSVYDQHNVVKQALLDRRAPALNTETNVFTFASSLKRKKSGDCGSVTWYRDADGDSYGNGNTSVCQFLRPVGYVNNDQDCDDSNDAINPGATEICDMKDNNCDGKIDDIPC